MERAVASSTSSSEEAVVRERASHALPSGLRLTAADRPGMAQPVPERDIPDQPWRAMTLTVMVLLLVLTSLWEWRMRTLQLVPGDLADNYDRWAELRRQVDTRDVPLAIVGDSRALYDTDLDRVAQLTGMRPLQLALTGSSGLPVLEDLGNDPHFKGLAIVGMAESTYFDTHYSVIRPNKALALSRWESPSRRGSYLVQRVISPGLAMLDDNYQLSTLMVRLDRDWRPGVHAARTDIWKVGESTADGQSWLWRRFEQDQRISEHTRQNWFALFPRMPLDDGSIQGILRRTKVAADKIRGRGGDVVFVRPPSAPDLRVIEDQHLPRARGWDALLAYTQSKGIHFDDLPAAQRLTLPESSHVTRACATVFTDAYVRSLAQQTPLLHLIPTAPAALTAQDCASPSAAPGPARDNAGAPLRDKAALRLPPA
jgi:hypothetical protein